MTDQTTTIKDEPIDVFLIDTKDKTDDEIGAWIDAVLEEIFGSE